MDMKPKTLAIVETIAMVLSLLVVAVVVSEGFYLVFKLSSSHRYTDKERIEMYKDKYQCEHTGYYGRNGEYKVYQCMGRVYKESEMK